MSKQAMPMKIVNRANKPPAPLTARTKWMAIDHSRRKRRGFFFGGAANCTLLDDTSNIVMSFFLFVFVNALSLVMGSRGMTTVSQAMNRPTKLGEDKPSPLLC